MPPSDGTEVASRTGTFDKPTIGFVATRGSLDSGTSLGSYRIERFLAVGGMGEVYGAHDSKLGRQVAIKIRPDSFTHDPERLARFRREAQILAALNHPHIGADRELSNHRLLEVADQLSGAFRRQPPFLDASCGGIPDLPT